MPRLAVLSVLSAASSPCPDLNLIHYIIKRKHGLIAIEDEFSMKWKARKKAEFLSSAFEIWRDMGGFEGAADAVKTAQ